MIYIISNEDGDVVVERRFTQQIKMYNDRILTEFLSNKQLEGKSEITINNYKIHINKLSDYFGKKLSDITTRDLKDYIQYYHIARGVSANTCDNIRRVLSSFYNWMEEEDYVIKSPARKIHKIKGVKIIKTAFSDEEIVAIKDAATMSSIRDKALIDFLYSTGVRVSECSSLNISDIDFANREAIVFGKGQKERIIYFDSATKVHLSQYLESRNDSNPALFVDVHFPYNRITKNGIEYIVSNIGVKAHVKNCHPHRFRRSLATRLLDRGVPIEQVQKILGHEKIDTTLIYAQVNQTSVKINHSKFC